MQCLVWQKLSLNLFFEKGLRGGVSYISKRYSKANNRYLNMCGPKQESKHIYLDSNNVYGNAMFKFLPMGGFKWIDPIDFDINKYTCNSSSNCIFQELYSWIWSWRS